MSIKKKGLKLLLSAVLLFSVILPLRAEAYVTLGGQWSDANDLTYWVSSTVDVIGFTDASDHGSGAWNNSTHIDISEQSSESGADIKWFGSSTDLGDFYADALNYVGNTPSWTGTYTNSVIRWNGPVAEDLSSTRAKETGTHEIGHSLGLGHSDTDNSIMLAIGWLYGTYPVEDDWNGIDAIYD